MPNDAVKSESNVYFYLACSVISQTFVPFLMLEHQRATSYQ